MSHLSPAKRSPSKAVWIIAYLASPALPFVCLRHTGAIGTLECACGVVVTLAAQLGLITVLGQTNGDPLQIFVILLLGLSLYMICLWHYLAGQRVGLWSEDAVRQWRFAGRFFGGLIAVGLVLGITGFHVRRLVDKERLGVGLSGTASSIELGPR